MCSSAPVLEQIPEGPSSLEKDLFPKLTQTGNVRFEQDGMFIDIGRPKITRGRKSFASIVSGCNRCAPTRGKNLRRVARPMVKAVFLDRDGVINRKPPEDDYVTSVGRLSVSAGRGQWHRGAESRRFHGHRRDKSTLHRERASISRQTSRRYITGCQRISVSGRSHNRCSLLLPARLRNGLRLPQTSARNVAQTQPRTRN